METKPFLQGKEVPEKVNNESLGYKKQIFAFHSNFWFKFYLYIVPYQSRVKKVQINLFLKKEYCIPWNNLFTKCNR